MRTLSLKVISSVLILCTYPVLLLAAEPEAAYPVRPIRLIVPFPAGSGPDAIARSLTEKLSTALGGAIVVDNRPGASGILGTDAVAKAAADGHTLLYGISGPIALNPMGLKKLSYDPQKDLTVVSQIQQRALVLLIDAKLPARTLAEFVVYAKNHPKSLAYATWGVATTAHVAGEYLNKQAGIDLLHVPYKEGYLNGIAGGQVAAAFAEPGSSKSLIDSGRVRALAIAGKNRSSLLPTVPTFTELGFPALEPMAGWHSVYAPARTPGPVLTKLNAEIVKIMRSADMIAFVKERGGEPAGTGLVESRRLVEEDHMRWLQALQAIGGLPPLE